MPSPETYENQEKQSILPNNATSLELALEGALRHNIYPVEDRHIYNPIRDAWDPEKIPAHLIPYMGANLGLVIDENLTETQQRMLLRCAWNLHQFGGTQHVILEIIRALGYEGVSIAEDVIDPSTGVQHWANYSLIFNSPVRTVDARAIFTYIRDLTPVRSWLVAADFTQATWKFGDWRWVLDPSNPNYVQKPADRTVIQFDRTYTWGAVTPVP